MRFALGVLVVLLNLADNATTFLCLRAPVPGFVNTLAVQRRSHFLQLS